MNSYTLVQSREAYLNPDKYLKELEIKEEIEEKHACICGTILTEEDDIDGNIWWEDDVAYCSVECYKNLKGV